MWLVVSKVLRFLFAHSMVFGHLEYCVRQLGETPEVAEKREIEDQKQVQAVKYSCDTFAHEIYMKVFGTLRTPVLIGFLWFLRHSIELNKIYKMVQKL